MKKSNTTNPEIWNTIYLLKKQSKKEVKSLIWKALVKKLVKSHRRNMVAVNLSRLNRCTDKNETVAIPGKVLGGGEIRHSLTVTALTFSKKAKTKIEAVNGRCLSFSDLIKENPIGSNIKILG